MSPLEQAEKKLNLLRRELVLETRPDERLLIEAKIEDLQAIMANISSQLVNQGSVEAVPPSPVSKSPLVKSEVLVLATKFPQLNDLDSTKETERIRSELKRGTATRSWSVQSVVDAKIDEFSRYLLEAQPEILHFSGHGNKGGLLWPDNSGLLHMVSPQILAEAVRLSKAPLRCVVFNACHSLEHADAFAPYCDAVIVMKKAIPDTAAIAFSTGFYRGLSAGSSLAIAFEFGCQQVGLVDSASAYIPEFCPGRRQGAFTPVNRSAPTTIEAGSASQEPHTPNGIDFPLWFGTDRALSDPDRPELGFSAKRANRLTTGNVSVFVPEDRPLGSMRHSWWKRMFLGKRDEVAIRWQTLRIYMEDIFWSHLSTALLDWQHSNANTKPDILVYIHGYNVSFQEAAERAAQLGCDLAIPGLTCFYSWSSQGALNGYPDDEASVEVSESYLTEFLVDLLQRNEGARINILAHSMGNRAILRSVQNLQSQIQRKFGHIILCAPDVDTDLFMQLGKTYPKVAEQTTLYVSDKDNAIACSRWLHGQPRVGLYDPVTVLPPLQTIAAGKVALGLLGHGYYAESRPVLADICSLLATNAPAWDLRRFGLRMRVTPTDHLNHPGCEYWELKS